MSSHPSPASVPPSLPSDPGHVRVREPLVLSACSPKILDRHKDRLAVVYVRQSTAQQVAENKESADRQYGLVNRAIELGWPPDRILVIDDDQGKSGSSAEGRPGFQRLLAEVGLDHVGLVLGLEMSRLARSCNDWHQLVCWVTRGCIPFAGRRPLGLLGPGSTD
jgi:hypothetical protein